MTIGGLLTILSKDVCNFEPVHIHDTRVVINGLDFMGSLYEGLTGEYGGEYLAFHLKIRAILESMKQCEIEPLIIFSGILEFRGHQLKTKLSKCQQHIEELFEESDNTRSLPACARMILTETLRKSRVQFTTVPYGANRSTAALGSLLNCPVLGNSSDYFLLTSREELIRADSSHVSRFIPLRYMSWDPVTVGSANFGHIILAHAYRSHHSELSPIAPRNRTIAGLLLGSDCMPQSRLPDAVKQQFSRNYSNKLHPKEIRWHMLLDWLSKFTAHSDEPVKELNNAHPTHHRILFLNQLLDCLGGYIYDPLIDGTSLLERFRIPAIQDCAFASNDENTPSTIAPQDEAQYQRTINQLLRGELISCINRTDFTAHWPNRLLHAFHTGRISCSFLNALYGQCLCMPVHMDDYNCETSVYEAALPIRMMHYRLLLKLEQQIKGPSRLGPHATEYIRRGRKMVAYELLISPLTIQLEHEHTDRVLGTFFGTTLPVHTPEPGWAFALAASLAIWHKQQPVRYRPQAIDQCPFTLALVACAVVVMNEVDDLGDELLQHYMQCATTIEQGLTTSSSSATSSLSGKSEQPRLEYTHQFTGVQLIYSSLQSLVNLLESLLPVTHESELFHFYPAWAIFPSGRLIHSLATKLATEDANRRCAVTRRFWIPRLYRMKQNTTTAAMELREIMSSFDTVLKTASSLDIKFQPFKFAIHEVEPTKPAVVPSIPRQGSDQTLRQSVVEKPVKQLPPPPPAAATSTNRYPSKPVEPYVSSVTRFSEPPIRRPLAPVEHATYAAPQIPFKPKRGGFVPRGAKQSGYSNRLLQRLKTDSIT